MYFITDEFNIKENSYLKENTRSNYNTNPIMYSESIAKDAFAKPYETETYFSKNDEDMKPSTSSQGNNNVAPSWNSFNRDQKVEQNIPTRLTSTINQMPYRQNSEKEHEAINSPSVYPYVSRPLGFSRLPYHSNAGADISAVHSGLTPTDEMKHNSKIGHSSKFFPVQNIEQPQANSGHLKKEYFDTELEKSRTIEANTNNSASHHIIEENSQSGTTEKFNTPEVTKQLHVNSELVLENGKNSQAINNSQSPGVIKSTLNTSLFGGAQQDNTNAQTSVRLQSSEVYAKYEKKSSTEGEVNDLKFKASQKPKNINNNSFVLGTVKKDNHVISTTDLPVISLPTITTPTFLESLDNDDSVCESSTKFQSSESYIDYEEISSGEYTISNTKFDQSETSIAHSEKPAYKEVPFEKIDAINLKDNREKTKELSNTSSSETVKNATLDHVLKLAVPYITETLPSEIRKVAGENDDNDNFAYSTVKQGTNDDLVKFSVPKPQSSITAFGSSNQNTTVSTGLLNDVENSKENSSAGVDNISSNMSGRKSGTVGANGFTPVVSEETKTSQSTMVNPFYNPFNSMPICYELNKLPAPPPARQNFNPYQMMPLQSYGYSPPMSPWFGPPPPQPFPYGPTAGVMPYVPVAPQDASPNQLLATDKKKQYYVCNPVSASSGSLSSMQEAEIRKTFEAFNLQDLVRQAPVAKSR